MSMASNVSFVIMIATLLFPSPCVYVMYSLLIPFGLFWYMYGSWIKVISMFSADIICIRLSVAALECYRLTLLNFICDLCHVAILLLVLMCVGRLVVGVFFVFC